MNNKTKIKEIKVTSRNSEFVRLQESFNKRWNIDNTKENRNLLKNRCLAVICNSLNRILEYYSREATIKVFCKDIEVLLGLPSSNTNWDNFNNTKLFKYINSLDINKDDDYNIFMYFIELSLNHFYYGEYVNTNILAKELAEALKLSNANVIICKNGDNYELYPIDVELLSDKLVVDVLSWLNEYPNTKKSFSKALKIKRTPDKYRNIIDELRLSIEFLFKQLFNNDKSLENQKNHLGNYLKENNVSTEISNMYIKLLNLYTTYNNKTAKHNDNVNEIEIDYIIYLTGSFIRFILLIEKSKLKIV